MASAFQANAFQNDAFQIEAGAVTPTTSGGGGAHRIRTLSPSERKRYRQYVDRLLAKRREDEDEETRKLEIAWNRAHGIEAPEVVEIPIAAERVVEKIERLPKRAKAERERLIAQLALMIADFRAELAAELELQAMIDEEEAIVALLLSW